MKKIMFCDRYGLTQAVIDGRKTMTRRIATFEGIRNPMIANVMSEGPLFGRHCLTDGTEKTVAMSAYALDEIVAVAQPLKDMGYNPNDRSEGHIYGLDHTVAWTNKMFVAASQCIHKIQITGICIERLQDISDENCLKEGIMIDANRLAVDDNIYVFDVYGKHKNRWYFPTPKEAFAALIDKVSGKGTWASNPWVFVYSFKLIK